MPIDLSHYFAKSVPVPKRGNRIHYDSTVAGFGLRVTAAGAKAFVLNYRTRSGRERRYTIGQFPTISVAAARKKAAELKNGIREGRDPLADIDAERAAPTIEDLCKRFVDGHLPNKRESTREGYRAAIESAILPAWRHRKIAEITFADVDALHRKITDQGTRKHDPRRAPYRANRVVAVLSKMFSLAVRWKWCADNPTKGLDRNVESKRRRYLSGDELAALLETLHEREEATHSTGQHRGDRAADIVRLLLLTGARRGEVLAARWGQFDLHDGSWTKPAATTKQNQEHRVPLSAQARKVLVDIRSRVGEPPADDDFIFPGRGTRAPQTTLKKAWHGIIDRATVLLFAARPTQPEGKLVEELRRSLGREPKMRDVDGAAGAMGIKLPEGLRDLRLHDLRHSYASFLASAGLSLPTIGALLGHTQPATTARYAHLFDDPLRQATERVGEIVSASDLSGYRHDQKRV
jgi:integrase